MIDIHSHILPGIDDGAACIDDSLAIARLAVADGIHTVVATPHCRLATAADLLGLRDLAIAELRARLAEEHIPLRILPGAECVVHPDLVAATRDCPGLLLGENGRAILVELAPSQPVAILDELLVQASRAERDLVLAHPERCPEVMRRPGLLEPLVRCGLHLQITSDSLGLAAGWRMWRTARSLVRRGLVAVLACDAHDPVGSRPRLALAVRRAARLLGRDARHLVVANPARLLGLGPGA